MNILIIGGEAAGMSAAAKAKRLNPNAHITVFEASNIISFGACGLPYFIGGEFNESEKMAEFTPEDFAKKGITVKTAHKVIKVDPQKQTLLVEHQDRIFEAHYDRLMIATGAKENRPPIAGFEKHGVHTLRTLKDGETIKAALQDPTCQHITVIGSGFIGLELVEAFIAQGKTVRLIERHARIMADTFDEAFAPHIQQALTHPKVQVHTNENVEAFLGEDKLSSVKTNRGTYATDLAIVCVGVTPNTEFLQDTGIECLANGAIKTDQQGKTSLPNVWAAGDCATIWHQLLQEPVYIPLATGANKLGRLVGENLADANKDFIGTLGSSCLKLFDFELARTGLSELEAQNAQIPHQTVFIKDKCHTNYCHGQSDIFLKLVYHAENKTLLGAQMLGNKGVVHRLDALAVAISLGATTEQLGWMDFAYAPPFARTWDIMNVAGNVAK